jgi:hypothetical protein
MPFDRHISDHPLLGRDPGPDHRTVRCRVTARHAMSEAGTGCSGGALPACDGGKGDGRTAAEQARTLRRLKFMESISCRAA